MGIAWVAEVVVFLFFFKQKTAYEMRISDWSSDVCSSDLDAPVTIEDRSSRVLAFSGRQDEADPSRIETIIGRQVPDRYANALADLGVFRDLYRSRQPVVVDPVRLDENVTTQRVAIAVRAGDEVLGSFWAAMDGPVTPARGETTAGG